VVIAFKSGRYKPNPDIQSNNWLYNVFRMDSAFITGVLAYKYFGFIKHNCTSISLILVIGYVIMFMFLSAEFYGSQKFPCVEEILLSGFHLIYRIIIGSVALLALISLVYYYRENISNSRLMTRITIGGKYTLEIYILQCYILEGYLGRD